MASSELSATSLPVHRLRYPSTLLQVSCSHPLYQAPHTPQRRASVTTCCLFGAPQGASYPTEEEASHFNGNNNDASLSALDSSAESVHPIPGTASVVGLVAPSSRSPSAHISEDRNGSGKSEKKEEEEKEEKKKEKKKKKKRKKKKKKVT